MAMQDTVRDAAVDLGDGVMAPSPSSEPVRELPNFKERMRAIWGDTVFPAGTGVKWVREDRDARG